MEDPPQKMGSQERAAIALWELLKRPHSTRELAQKLGLSDRGTLYLLCNISGVVPIYDYRDGRKTMWDVRKELIS